MSFGKRRNKLHFDAREIARVCRDALQLAVAGRPNAAAALAEVAGCTERTAENWLAGDFAPRAQHLIALMAEFPEVTEAVLEMAGRNQPADAERVRRAIALLEGRE